MFHDTRRGEEQVGSGPSRLLRPRQRLNSQSSGHFVCRTGAQFATHLEHSLNRDTLSVRWIYLTCLPQPWQALYHHDFQHAAARADDSSPLLASVKTKHSRESAESSTVAHLVGPIPLSDANASNGYDTCLDFAMACCPMLGS